MADPRTGTELNPLDQALAELNQSIMYGGQAPSYANPLDPRSNISRGLGTLTNVAQGGQNFGDVASSYAQRKIGELPGLHQKNPLGGDFYGQIAGQNLSEYTESVLLGALPDKWWKTASKVEGLKQDFKGGVDDWKNLLKNDVANALNLPDKIKDDVLSGTTLSTATKDYLVDKVNESPLQINISKKKDRRRGEVYTLSKSFGLGSNASVGIKEELGGGRKGTVIEGSYRKEFDHSKHLNLNQMI